uniref:Uncharacterized protein n=1 Tax=uncultured marine virus TaxID=186617 RepID=A0A0F7LB60_9VIRU|nr:hypothetical protein [uncultured marine virus]
MPVLSLLSFRDVQNGHNRSRRERRAGRAGVATWQTSDCGIRQNGSEGRKDVWRNVRQYDEGDRRCGRGFRGCRFGARRDPAGREPAPRRMGQHHATTSGGRSIKPDVRTKSREGCPQRRRYFRGGRRPATLTRPGCRGEHLAGQGRRNYWLGGHVDRCHECRRSGCCNQFSSRRRNLCT